MLRRLLRVPVVAVLVGAVLWATQSSARAGFSIKLTDVNTGQVLTVNDNDVNDSNTATNTIQYTNSAFGNFDVNITAKTNSPGGQINGLGIADRLSDITITTKNVGTSPNADTLIFDVVSDGFTSPGRAGATMLLTNALASTGIDAGGSGKFTSSLNSFSSPSVTLTDSDVGSDGTGPKTSAKSTLTLTLDSNPYTISNELSITLASGSQAQFTGTTTATLPAPAGLVLALSGLPFLGITYVRRRRKSS